MYNEFIKIKQSNEDIEYFKRELKKKYLLYSYIGISIVALFVATNLWLYFVVLYFLINGYFNKFMLIMFTPFLYKLNNYRLHFEKKNDRLFTMYLSPKTIKYKYLYLLALLSLTSFL